VFVETLHLHPLTRRSTGTYLVAGALAVASVAAVAATPASASPAPGTAATGSGPVDVLYAGSLVEVMTKQIDPAFKKATGYTVSDFSAGSDALATDIKGKTQVGDVFLSASPSVNTELEGASNGNWVSWYATFATSKLVLGYNPKSKFAKQLTSEPWYKVVGQKGFLLGRTDPATDPKGVLADDALNAAAKADNEPGLVKLGTEKSDVFPEETLVGRLQSGQLDAGFFYAAEAAAANIKTVPIAGANLVATYTLTVLNNAPHAAGAAAFVKYLLSAPGQAALRKDGFVLVTPPKVTGTGVPSSLTGTLGS
jgi:molybdate/tungstate transport system substrate-binding protein